MAVTVDQLCSLQELPLVVQSPSCPPPSTSSTSSTTHSALTLPVTDSSMTNSLSIQNGIRVERGNGSRTVCHHGNSDQEYAHGCGKEQEYNAEFNSNSDPECSRDHGCTDGDDNRHSECRPSADPAKQPGRQAGGGASYLRQQWAIQTNTEPKLHVMDVPPSADEAERERDCSHGAHQGGRESGGGERQLQQGWNLRNSVPDTRTCTGKPSPTSDHHHSHSSPEGAITKTPPPSAGTRPSRQLLKTQSVDSISSESLTISSLWEAPSYDTIPDFLSSLGFDDFDSPELIPDRFIPPELDFMRPSLMRQATLGSVSTDTLLTEQLLSPPSDGLYLGATADTVSDPTINVDQQSHTGPVPPQTLAIYLPSKSPLPWQPASLETVVEETGSELLSPRPPSRLSARLTPRLTSPLLSIDYTPTQDLPAGIEGDVSAGLLGAGLAQRLRMQVLAKEDLRQRQMSLGAESDTSSLYFSVASHFEDGDKDGDTGSSSANREGGGATGTTAAPVEEGSEAVGGRRRRHSNYAPPPQLLMWLEESPESADTADQPWPFNESSSQDHSPADRMHSDPPLSVSLNGNSNNNCPHISGQRLQLSARNSLPILSQREQHYVGAEMMSLYNRVQNQRLDEGGIHMNLKLRDINSCHSSAYHRTSHAPPPI